MVKLLSASVYSRFVTLFSPNGSNHQLSLIAGENRRYSPENPVRIFVTKL